MKNTKRGNNKTSASLVCLLFHPSQHRLPIADTALHSQPSVFSTRYITPLSRPIPSMLLSTSYQVTKLPSMISKKRQELLSQPSVFLTGYITPLSRLIKLPSTISEK